MRTGGSSFDVNVNGMGGGKGEEGIVEKCVLGRWRGREEVWWNVKVVGGRKVFFSFIWWRGSMMEREWSCCWRWNVNGVCHGEEEVWRIWLVAGKEGIVAEFVLGWWRVRGKRDGRK